MDSSQRTHGHILSPIRKDCEVARAGSASFVSLNEKGRMGMSLDSVIIVMIRNQEQRD